MGGATDYYQRALGRQAEARRRLRQLGELGPREVFPLLVAERLAEGESELNPKALLRDSIAVAPALDALFVLWLTAAGGSRRGARTFSFQATRGGAEMVLAVIPRGILTTPANLKRKQVSAQARNTALWKLLTSLGLDAAELDYHVKPEQVRKDAPCAVALDATRDAQLRLRVVTVPGEVVKPGGLLHTWPLEGSVKRPPARPDEVVEVLHVARQAGLAVQDPNGIAGPLETLVRRSVAIHEVRGMPGLCDLTEGQPAGPPVKRRRLSCLAGVRVARRRQAAGEPAMVAERVAEMAAMAEAKPALDGVLLPPQRRVVGAQLAASSGLLNVSAVGTGKTVMTLIGQRLAAKTEPGFRALIVVASELRDQWVEEAREHFGGAGVLLPAGGKGFARELVAFEHRQGERPGLVIASYEQARIGVADLEVLTYSQLVVDEAARLCNPSTQLSRALWRLRRRAALAIGLTGTPYGRSLEEIDALVGFPLEDERCLRERRIARNYNGFDTLSRKRLHEALGPLLQRVTRAELSEQLPELGDVETLRLSPGPDLQALLSACESQIAELYRAVKERVEEQARAGSKLAEQARRELQQMRGILLGAVTSARMAKDPESLRGSRGQVAQLLEADGLIERAVAEGSPPRRVCAQTIADAVRDGEQVLCFSEFSSHLELLADELRREHGLELPIYGGATPKAEREQIKRRFRAGQLGCVLIAPLGREGHNFQPASAEALSLHYDLPWIPRGFEQRSGRGARLGTAAGRIGVLIPVLRHSVEERVARILVPRAAKAVELQACEDEPEPLAAHLHGLADELSGDDDASTLLQVCQGILEERSNGT